MCGDIGCVSGHVTCSYTWNVHTCTSARPIFQRNTTGLLTKHMDARKDCLHNTFTAYGCTQRLLTQRMECTQRSFANIDARVHRQAYMMMYACMCICTLHSKCIYIYALVHAKSLHVCALINIWVELSGTIPVCVRLYAHVTCIYIYPPVQLSTAAPSLRESLVFRVAQPCPDTCVCMYVCMCVCVLDISTCRITCT